MGYESVLQYVHFLTPSGTPVSGERVAIDNSIFREFPDELLPFQIWA
jgi:hypothetical protein